MMLSIPFDSTYQSETWFQSASRQLEQLVRSARTLIYLFLEPRGERSDGATHQRRMAPNPSHHGKEKGSGRTPLRERPNRYSHSRWTDRTLISGSSSSFVLSEQIRFVAQREFGQNTRIGY